MPSVLSPSAVEPRPVSGRPLAVPLLLRLCLPNGSVKKLRWTGNRSVTVGRDREAADVALDDAQLSRCHVRFERNGDTLTVCDAGSSNGTWLNGERIDGAVELVDGDVVLAGITRIFAEEESEASSDPLIGRNLGDCEILGVLGKGGCGTVYRAVQTTLGRPVALKVLRSDWLHNEAHRRAFLQEARNAGMLSHPHLLQVHDVVESPEHCLMIMEFCQGGSLAELLEDDGAQSLDDSLRMIAEIATALSYLHGKGLLHRDVKPGNVLINADGAYKLADLGIAVRMGPDGLVAQKRFAGSPAYLAPEQANGKPIGARADLYSLGATAWHMLTGKTIYEGSPLEVVRQQVEAPLPDLRKLVSGLGTPVVQFFYKLLAKVPADRASDPAQVAQEALNLLRSIRQTPGSSGAIRRRRTTRRGGLRRRLRRSK